MIRFDGEVALITGAARGQGAAEARLIADLGGSVVLGDLDVAEAQAIAASIGNQALAVHLDVTDEESWDAAIDATISRFGKISILVNNAALFRAKTVLTATLTDIEALISVNLVGTLLGVQRVGRRMMASGEGSIVNIASVAAEAPDEASTIYGMTKAAVVALTAGAAVELGPRVRVNCVLPGGIDTRMLSQEARPFFKFIPLQRAGTSEEIANVVAFLASSASSYVTGIAMRADGGWRLGNSFQVRKTLIEAAERGN